MQVTVRALKTDGSLLLDLNDKANGYAAVVLPDIERAWDVQTSESPFVDGNTVERIRLAATTLQLRVRVRGETWAQVEQRYQELLAAVERRQWLLAEGREGVVRTWRCTVPDSSSPGGADAVVNRMRVVTLSIPAQPTPTLTGV